MNKYISKNTVLSAQILFGKIVSDNKLDKLKIKGFDGKHNFSELIVEKGWLALFMRRSDEIAKIVLDNSVVWDAVYEASRDAIEGVIPIDIEKRSELELASGVDNDLLTPSMKYLICNKAINDMIIVEKGVVDIRKIDTFGLEEYSFQHGDIIPLLDRDILIIRELKDLNSQIQLEYNNLELDFYGLGANKK